MKKGIILTLSLILAAALLTTGLLGCSPLVFWAAAQTILPVLTHQLGLRRPFQPSLRLPR